MQRLVFFDLDGTLIDNPSSEKLYVFWLLMHGHIGLKQITKWFSKLRSEAIVRNKAYLYDMSIKETVHKAKQFAAKKLLSRLRPNIMQRLEQHKTNNDIVILLTGAPKFIAEVFAKQLGVFEIRATEFSILNDCFNDSSPLQHPFGQEKVTVAQKVCDKYNLALSDSVAYGNSIHDLALLEKVGQAIAVTPDNKLRRIATKRNWEIL